MNLNFNLDRFIRFNTAGFLRKPIMKAFLKVLLTNTSSLFAELKEFRTKTLQELQTTILTNVLQTKLRLLYPNIGFFKVHVKTNWDDFPTAYIQYLGEHHKQEYIYGLAEAQPPQYIWNRAEMVLPFDYVIIIPIFYTSNLPAITAFVNKFRPAGKRYIIQFSNII